MKESKAKWKPSFHIVCPSCESVKFRLFGFETEEMFIRCDKCGDEYRTGIYPKKKLNEYPVIEQ